MTAHLKSVIIGLTLCSVYCLLSISISTRIEFAPPVLKTGDVFAWEGDPLNVHLHAFPGPGGLIESYQLDLNNDGVFEHTFTVPPEQAAYLEFQAIPWSLPSGLIDNGDYPATVRVNTNKGAKEFPVFIHIGNMPTGIDICDPYEVPLGVPFPISLSWEDPGDDTVTHILVDWGDGTIEHFTPADRPISHIYTRDGCYDIYATVTDEDGSWSTYTIALAGDVSSPPNYPDHPTINGAHVSIDDASGKVKVLLDVVPGTNGHAVSYRWDLGRWNFDRTFFATTTDNETLMVEPESDGRVCFEVVAYDSTGHFGDAHFDFIACDPEYIKSEYTFNTYGDYIKLTPAGLPKLDVKDFLV